MYFFFFFNDTAPTEIYTLPLHDALPISHGDGVRRGAGGRRHVSRHDLQGPRRAGDRPRLRTPGADAGPADRKSTRLNSSHANISYAVFCLKKKKKNNSEKHTSL